MPVRIHEFIIRSELGSQPEANEPRDMPSSTNHQSSASMLQGNIQHTFIDIIADLLNEQQER